CISLTSITIPNSVTRIEDGTFSSCSALSSITIPNSVTSIRWYAFQGCKQLTSFTNLNPTPQNVSSNVSSGVGLSKMTLYVPAEAIAAYRAANAWKNFGTITAHVP
ncbi:MAG: leucine-rich repeat domain-containing protein, partial [Odoribacteraceae bacterium]|nr:leucine-rich repeat domain-containing protein [Odoribacteraceae bacterium]